MELTQEEIRKRLAYIMHLGWVETRNLASSAGQQQIADLADALEILPRLMVECNEEDLELIRFVLRDYEAKYHTSYNLPARFEDGAPARY
jgi:hypothetical protein